MTEVNLLKIQSMLSSSDEEMVELGFSTLTGFMTSYEVYRTQVSGLQVNGSPLVPKELRARVKSTARKIERERIKNEY